MSARITNNDALVILRLACSELIKNHGGHFTSMVEDVIGFLDKSEHRRKERALELAHVDAEFRLRWPNDPPLRSYANALCRDILFATLTGKP